MELLDGQVLSSTIGGRALKTADVIDLGTQIADALDARTQRRHRPPRRQAGETSS
jgi:hypothetical protein